ncbi:MAG: adenylate cyclase [Rhodobiaceae bacterium]|nr:adenylate cyclase [Rhodobiaceae bacterium]
MKRKLTTILCADAVNFSAAMSRDERATHTHLSACRTLMEDAFARHDGRKVNTWGDAVIAEFASVVEAVECAVAIQKGIGEANDALPAGERLDFRIGINLGDVMIDGDDLMGEGVNIAARLQEIAEPGGIVISRPVFDHVYRRLSVGIDPMAPISLKNIDQPIELYRVRVGSGRTGTQWDGARAMDARMDFGDIPDPLPPAPMAPSGSRIETLARTALAWYRRQPRRARTGVNIVIILAVIDFLTSPGTLWFFWPAIPILLFAFRPWRQLAEDGEQQGHQSGR